MLGLRGLFEQPGVVLLNLIEVPEQHRGKSIPAFKSKKAGKAFEFGPVGRQALRLLVIHHLQAMFDDSKETVSFFHCVARLDIYPFVRTKFVERRQRVAVAKRRIAAACDQLLRLRKKFDLTNATTAEFDVMSFDRDFTVAAISVDLPLHCVNVGKCDEIEIFTPDERREFMKDRLADRYIAGARARLNHGSAFPVLANALVIRQG